MQQQQAIQIQLLKDITIKLKDQLLSSDEELTRIELEQIKLKEQHQQQQDEMQHENQQLKQQIDDLQQKKKKKTPPSIHITSPIPSPMPRKFRA